MSLSKSPGRNPATERTSVTPSLRAECGSHALDIIVQNSVVDLFGTYDVAVAPVPGVPSAPAHITRSLVAGMIEFRGDSCRGQVALSIATALAQATSRTLGRVSQSDQDWVRELTSQLMGRIRTRMARFGVHVRAGLPTATMAGAIGRQLLQNGQQLNYGFRSIKGDAFVILAGQFSPECFASGSPRDPG